MLELSYGLNPSGLYRHRRGLGLHKVGYNGRRSEYPHRQACLPCQGKSHLDTGRSLQSCIFIVQESGSRYSPATRTPPNPGLPQACTHFFQSALRQYRYHLRKSHFEGKANNEIAQTSLVQYITDEDWTTLVKHWSDPRYQVGYMYLIRPHIEFVFMYVPYKCIFF